MLKINNLSFEKFLKNLEIGVSIFVVSFLLEFAVCLFFLKNQTRGIVGLIKEKPFVRL